jgi:uncharacterized protein (DUF433 family)
VESRNTSDYGIAPRYSIAEAARILRVKAVTLRTWCVGWKESKGRRGQVPVITPDGDQIEGTYLSFFNLIEAGFLNAYRETGAPMQRVRSALDFCRSPLEIRRPLLTERFRIDGRDLVLQHDRGLLNASASGQYIWPELVERWLREIDFDSLGPIQVWIAGRDKSILVNPRIGFGLPILASCGVRTEEVVSRFHAGDELRAIAEDLGAKEDEVLEAIRWETTPLAA